MGRSRAVARSRIFKPFWHMLLWPDSRAALRESPVLDVNFSRESQFPSNILHHHQTRDAHVQHMFGTPARSWGVEREAWSVGHGACGVSPACAPDRARYGRPAPNADS